MRWTTKKSVEISVLHSLEGLPKDHKCSSIHGHQYTVTVEISAAKLNRVGMVVDFYFIDSLVKSFDQKNLNDCFEPSTPENFCLHLLDAFEMELTTADMAARKMQIESISVCEQHETNEVRYYR